MLSATPLSSILEERAFESEGQDGIAQEISGQHDQSLSGNSSNNVPQKREKAPTTLDNDVPSEKGSNAMKMPHFQGNRKRNIDDLLQATTKTSESESSSTDNGFTVEEPPLKQLCHRNLRSNSKSEIPDGNLNKDMIKAIEEQVKEQITS